MLFKGFGRDTFVVIWVSRVTGERRPVGYNSLKFLAVLENPVLCNHPPAVTGEIPRQQK